MKIPTDENFGAMVREYRELRKWSMTEFASKLRDAGLANFHPTTISRMERGERPAKIGEAAVIAQVLGTQLDNLVDTPLEAYFELEFEGKQLEMVAKWAAWWAMRAEDDKADILRLASDLEQLADEGKVPGDELEASVAYIAKWRALVAQDRVKFWLDHIRGLSEDEREEFKREHVR
ncbi:helix-turn-helix domain-containing protein [Paeniglutamicibacter psychrophenolicus]|uniref:helix-turn-helix domain-containing protein n=1 Tax=Paeniglutamicibacter psychrophenolicus TaxID=257454 RepID=UPI002789FE1E|nr:helix-turn-helix transcriptional regulator [Paeniglutamicibacter psychrophenolicus]MDQ0094417.1 transcriptional regulator with XRE-family HTH domain [Paeniglutamicibacter psychrophenolicus]